MLQVMQLNIQKSDAPQLWAFSEYGQWNVERIV